MKQAMEQKARQQIIRLQQQIEAQFRYQSDIESDIYNQNNRALEQQQYEIHQHQQLTDSVAEFFRKAEQNFYSQASIDPTKVRRLSEVEAEIIGGNY